MTYEYKTQPFPPQEELFLRTRDIESRGCWWEQGVGKSKPTIDIVGYQYEQGNIDALLVIAPPGVEWNWVDEQIPEHMPERILEKARMMVYASADAARAVRKGRTGRSFLARWNALLENGGLSVLAISYDAFMASPDARKFVWEFFKQRRVYYVLDEGHAIKSPAAKRTISILASAKYAKFRRILTGTPIAQHPFDLYTLGKFIDPLYWRGQGLHSMTEFRARFGIFRERIRRDNGRKFSELLGYQRLDELQQHLLALGDRLTKEDAGLEIPPKVYSRRPVEMNSQQRRAYDELRERYRTELETGEQLEASMMIVRLTRLHQIACGYAVPEAGGDPVPLGKNNPRLEAALDIVENLGQSYIIWCRFTPDVDALMNALGDRAVRYDGLVSDQQKLRNKKAFQAGDVQGFVGKASSGGSGLTLIQARTVLFYSNTFRLVDRMQAEDRAHRAGQKHSVNYIDLAARGTIDLHIVRSLRQGFDVASRVTGDKYREWL